MWRLPGVRVNRAVPRHPNEAGPDVWYDQSLVASRMKTTRYFDEQVRRKRSYIDPQWCSDVIATPLQRERQRDGRIRYWGEVTVPGEVSSRVLRVVTLEDGETIHNAFFDRGFRKEGP